MRKATTSEPAGGNGSVPPQMGGSYGIEHRANQVNSQMAQNQNLNYNLGTTVTNTTGGFGNGGGAGGGSNSTPDTGSDRIKEYTDYASNLQKTVGNLTASGIKLDTPQDPKKK